MKEHHPFFPGEERDSQGRSEAPPEKTGNSEKKMTERAGGTVLGKIRNMDSRVKGVVQTLGVFGMLQAQGDAGFSGRTGEAETDPGQDRIQMKLDNERQRMERARKVMMEGTDEERFRFAEEIRKIPGGDAVLEYSLKRALDEKKIGLIAVHPKLLVESKHFDEYIDIFSSLISDLEIGYSWESLSSLGVFSLDELGVNERSEKFVRVLSGYFYERERYGVILSSAETLVGFEAGRKMLDKAGETLVEKGVSAVRDQGMTDVTHPYILGRPYGRELLSLFSDTNDNLWIENMDRLDAVPWGKEFIEKRSAILFDRNPGKFLKNIEKIEKYRPDLTGGTGVQICVEKLSSSEDARTLLEFLSLFIHESYAEKRISEAARLEPGIASIKLVRQLEEIDNPAWLRGLLGESVKVLYGTEPASFAYLVFQYEKIREMEFTKKAMLELAERQPELFLTHYVGMLSSYPSGKELFRIAIDSCLEKDGRIVVAALGCDDVGKFLSDREVSEILDSAIRNDPLALHNDPAHGGLIIKPRLLSSKENGSPLEVVLRSIFERYPDIFSTDNKRALTLLGPIMQKKMTIEDVGKIKDDVAYIKALSGVIFEKNPIGELSVRRELKEACLMEVQRINGLHEQADDIRFKSLEKFSATETYELMTYGEEEVYTSSFNGMFDRLIRKMKAEGLSGDQLLERAHSDQFRSFFKECVVFGRLNDFFSTMSESGKMKLVADFIGGLDADGSDMLEQAVIVAESLNMAKDPALSAEMRTLIRKERVRVEREGKKDVGSLYTLLEKVSNVVDTGRESGGGEGFPDFSRLRIRDVVDSDGRSIQRYHFYSDDDGKASFAHFLEKFRSNGWDREDRGSYVVIRNGQGSVSVEMYANKPGEPEGEDAIDEFFSEKKLTPSIFVHRGHSYHVDESLPHLTPKSGLVVFGSCGGYSNLSKVIDKSPKAQLISTKGTGTMLINDTYLELLNRKIALGKDIDWKGFRSELEPVLGKNSDFSAYVWPDQNIGVMFLKAYRQSLNSNPE